MPEQKRSFLELMKRGIWQVCPHCGKGRLFARKVELHKSCPECGIIHERSSGDTWAFLLFIDRALLLPPLMIVVFTPITWIGRGILILLFGVFFIITIPHRRGLTIALDYYTRVLWPDPNDDLPDL